MKYYSSKNRRVWLLMCLIFWAGYSVLSVPSQVGQNQIVNGDFESPLVPEKGQRWEFCCAGQGKMDIDKKEFVKGDQSMVVTVDVVGATTWEPHVKIIGLNVEEGKKYTYSAFMKAEEPRRTLLGIRRCQAQIFYGNSGEIQIGTEWKEYSCTVTASESNVGDVMVLTQLGVNQVNTWIDDARFYEGEYTPDPELEVVQKAVFASDKLALTWASIKKGEK